VLLAGRDLARRRPERIRQAGLAIVPERRRLLAELTVEENLRVATYALPAEQARAGRERALELFPEIGRRLSAQARTLPAVSSRWSCWLRRSSRSRRMC
jgi:branched-chain amino acid transport system ATP-binding protein